MNILLYFSLGASIASFLGLVVDRFPEQSIILPASHCNHCQKRLGVCEMIPILSQMYYNSRCKHCQYIIPKRYMVIEAASGVAFVLFGLGYLQLATLLALFMSLTLALYDYDQQEYPVLVWLIFTMLLLPLAHDYTLFIILCLLGILAYLFPLKMGSGDFLYLASLSLISDKVSLLWIIQIGSWLGIIYIIKQKQEKKPIAFVPFLAIGFATILLIQQLNQLF
ncbi:prepilin peptidase [Streptococcus sciuri]|uniref:Prepilin peptidase n=1 Tax=Streptococcus sciuri TaxID=2973939 RepID=A0ABT2F833_9STRE|nr:A24 family peptidase [Streptococcus sciuri]MCS4488579.1 prepilin peptidase [Streptococcus sciuri]